MLDKIKMIEADVNVGTVEGSTVVEPIMAHPPNTTSDISLKQFVQRLFEAKTGQGIKFDFKSIDIVEQSLKILQSHEAKVRKFTLFAKIYFFLLQKRYLICS